MKKEYLDKLKILLEKYDIASDEMQDIINDYEEMIDDALNKEMTEPKIIKLIGTPEEVVESLAEEIEKDEDFIYIHRVGKPDITSNKLTAYMPIIAIIVFFILGFEFGLWHPGWLVFLSIPVVSVFFSTYDKHSMNGLIALSPLGALVLFLVLGFWKDLWHPGWLIFFVVPIIAILSSAKTMRVISMLTAISPFATTIAFVLVGEYTGLWNPIWLVFLIIPMVGVLHEKKVWKVVLFELGFLIAISLYLFLGYSYNEWGYGLFAFLIPVEISLILSEDSFFVINKNNKFEWFLWLIISIFYVVMGVLFNSTWAYLWMLFFLIPVSFIFRKVEKDKRFVALTPIISAVIFFSVGYFFGGWAYSWLIFLSTPIVGLIKNI